jgi:hypothetical protein
MILWISFANRETCNARAFILRGRWKLRRNLLAEIISR